MNAWMSLWSIVLIISLAAYAVLVAVVTVGGLKDILAMFRTVAKQHNHPAAPTPTDQETDT